MVKRTINLVSGIIFTLSIGYFSSCFAIKTFFRGTIQFPHTMSAIPNIRIYSSGYKIKSETTAHGLTFDVPEEKNRKKFNILVTEKIQFQTEDDTNTIQYLKIDEGQKYKFYTVYLIKNDDDIHFDTVSDKKTNKKALIPCYEWDIEEHALELANGRIPDDAIIICFNPSYIDHLEGGNALEFPRIVIKKNVVQLAGSEDNLLDASTTLLLSSLDTDTIHANIRQEIKNDYQKTRITMIAA